MSFTYMKILESRPSRYDVAMNLLMLGRLNDIKEHIASFTQAGNKVLDLGCGTGTLARLLLAKGATVVGVDNNNGMLNIARQNAPGALYMSFDITQLDEHFDDESFDLIVSTLVFSELNDVERIFVLKQVRRLLKPAGKVFIGDEVIPGDILSRIVYYIIRIPTVFITWVVTQNTTRALPENIVNEFKEAGLAVFETKNFFFGMFSLIEAGR